MLTHSEMVSWLRETDAARLEDLWEQADQVRRAHVGDAVHLRGLVEISNFCARQCAYCGIRSANADLQRYRMTMPEILGCARKARDFGYGTVVMQSGEDPGISMDWMAEVIRAIKAETGLAVTLSLGERTRAELAAWREAGADRYLARFETSNRALYERIHPPRPGEYSDRIAMLRTLRELGYEVGSGVLIGIPGQSFEDLAKDLELFRELDLDMIGVGPYIPHPGTPMAKAAPLAEDQAPNTEEMAYKMLALTRLVRPDANLPSTTALATVNREAGRQFGLMRGANVVMPNVTPPRYRRLYEIYPSKAGTEVSSESFRELIHRQIAALGRTVGTGPGGRWQVA